MNECDFVAKLEFVAEDDMVEIVPNLKMDALNLISVSISRSLCSSCSL